MTSSPFQLYYGEKLLYEAQPRQDVFHKNPYQCRMYGGAAGGGKTEAILWEAVFHCLMNKKLKGAIFRRNYPEIEKYFIQRAMDKLPKSAYRYNKQKHVMVFTATGSQIEFCQCEGDYDLPNYQGAEWDFLAIDEFTQFTEYQFKYLFGRLRTSKADWLPIFFGGCNPGGIGHAWVKRIFVDQELTLEERRFSWAFIPAKLEDNPKMLEFNPFYEDQLMVLPDPVLREAMRHGNWNIFAGQYFSEIRYDIHGFEPFEIPLQWKRFIAVDYGYDHPAVALFFAIDDNKGDIWIYKELVTRKTIYSEFAKLALEMIEEGEKIDYAVADPSIWKKDGRKGDMSGAEEVQDEFDKKKINIIKADNDRLNGWGIMREWLKVSKSGDPHTGKPIEVTRLHISTALKFTWKTIPQLQRDPKKPEDVLKSTQINEDGTISYSDDAADALRYGLMSRPQPNKKKFKDTEFDRYGQKIIKESRSPSAGGFKVQGRPEWKPFGNQKPKWQGNR